MKNGITVVSAAAIDFLWRIGYNNPVWADTERLRQYRIFCKRTDEMYYYVKGELALLESDRAVIDCGGVGYLLSITKNTYDELVSGDALTASGDAAEKTVKLFTYYHVREDAAELYGFFTENECSLFKLLIGVSGVGPKAALSVLSALSPSSFIAAVLSDDAKAVSKAQGVGLKSAQKIILELKDKLSSWSVSDEGTFTAEPEVTVNSDAEKEAVEALTVLGYTKKEALAAVKHAKGGSVEELIRSALASLM